MFTFKENPVTGNLETTFSAKLLSISDKEIQLQSENKAMARVCSVEFKDVNGEAQRSTALMYSSNFKYIKEAGEFQLNEVDQSWYPQEAPQHYLATAIDDPSREGDNILITVSHLKSAGERATKSMFGFNRVNKSEVVEAEEPSISQYDEANAGEK